MPGPLTAPDTTAVPCSTTCDRQKAHKKCPIAAAAQQQCLPGALQHLEAAGHHAGGPRCPLTSVRQRQRSAAGTGPATQAPVQVCCFEELCITLQITLLVQLARYTPVTNDIVGPQAYPNAARSRHVSRCKDAALAHLTTRSRPAACKEMDDLLAHNAVLLALLSDSCTAAQCALAQ